jgi:hypothetical protein
MLQAEAHAALSERDGPSLSLRDVRQQTLELLSREDSQGYVSFGREPLRRLELANRAFFDLTNIA